MSAGEQLPDAQPVGLTLGTGVHQHVGPELLGGASARFNAAWSYAIRSETHLWIATTGFAIAPASLASLEAEPLNLDLENLLVGPLLGCYVCEQSYTPRMMHRRCPGEPKP